MTPLLKLDVLTMDGLAAGIENVSSCDTGWKSSESLRGFRLGSLARGMCYRPTLIFPDFSLFFLTF
jgi:hypothetical protein